MKHQYRRGAVLASLLWAASFVAFAQTATALPDDAATPAPLVSSAPVPPVEPSSYAPRGGMPTDPAAPTGQAAQPAPRGQETPRGPQTDMARFAGARWEAEQPSNFQRFVQQATGRLLPVYGHRLFSTPTGYAPISQAVVPNDYVIGPGDEIRLQVWGSIDAEFSLVVNRHGQISLPKVGVVNLAGVRAGDLESVLRSKIGRIFRNFDLNATLGRLRSIQVYVVGQARQPGTHTVSSLSTLINALFEVGGPNNNGSMRLIQLKRNGELVGELDLYDFIARGDRSGDVPLQPGDVIVIPPVGPRVAVLGAFEQPAIYELKGTSSIGEVLDLGGGLSVLAKPEKALLERIEPGSEKPRQVEDFPLDTAGLARPLRDGDILTLFEISPQFANAVTLRGNVAQPLRYPYTEGMRVRDLIPNREALITPDYYHRKNLLVQFEKADQAEVAAWEQRITPAEAETGQPDKKPQADKLARADGISKADKVDSAAVERGVRNLLDEVNWDYAVIERLDRGTLTTRLIPFNLARAVIDGDTRHNLELQPGDIVTILSKKDLRVPQDRQTRLVRVEGEVAAPGIYQIETGETLPQLIARLGGVTPNAYLYGAEFTRESVRKQQQKNLDTLIRKLEAQLQAEAGKRMAEAKDGSEVQLQLLAQQQQLERMKALKSNGRVSLELPLAEVTLDALPPLPLEDGDAIHIPSRPGFVTAVGEVYNENAIIYRSGRTVGDVLETVGVTDSGELRNAFVLRADGSVKAARDANSIFMVGGFKDIELMPGDTVVVPGKLDRRTNWTKFVAGLKDWTQIIYQMGLGIAAWNTLDD